jgi:hypothetical protein
MSEDDRLPGESEADHRHRLLVKRRGEEDLKRKEALGKYLPATESIAKSLGEQVKTVLEDLIGPTKMSLTQPEPPSLDSRQPPRPPTHAIVNARLDARATSASDEVWVIVSVKSVMDGSESPEDMAYSLSGNFGHKDASGQTSGMNLPISSSGIQRPTVDLDRFRREMRKLARLA